MRSTDTLVKALRELAKPSIAMMVLLWRQL